MQSRISFFDKAVFRKNLTRFAPAWGLYTVCMFLGLFLMLDSGNTQWLAPNMGDCLRIMAVITPCYALLTAQLLFGDLFNSRMCNALHALPLRRETWYMTNLASGLVFHLIPTAAMAPVSALIIALSDYDVWMMAFGWLLGVNLQYLCFFGIGVLCAMLTASRFAMALTYGIVNFAALIAAWMVDTLYIPMLYGVQLQLEPFYWFCPVAKMIENDFLLLERYYHGIYGTASYGKILIGENFGYYFLCAAVGLVLMGLALQLYRRRRLECAGDFIAFKVMEPVFHVVYSLIVGAVFAFVVDDLFGMGTGYGMAFLFAGLAVGYFTGRMLLIRSPKVFQLKGWMGCGGLMIVFALSLLLAALDIFGIVRWMPKAEQVESVTVWDTHSGWHDSQITLTDPAEIEKVIAVHSYALEDRGDGMIAAPIEMVTTEEIPEAAENTTVNMHFSLPITIQYQMKNGRVSERCYYIWMDSTHGENLMAWFSSFAGVFDGYTDTDKLLDDYKRCYIADSYDGTEHYFPQKEVAASLLEAVRRDCEAGTMAQSWRFHPDQEQLICWLYLESDTKFMECRIYSSCENTVQWLRDHDYPVDELLEKLKY